MENITCAEMTSTAGAALGLVGSLVLAYSLNPALTVLRANVLAIDTTIQATYSGQNIPVFTGFEKQHERTFASATWRVRFGGWLLAAGFLAQACAVILW